MPNVSSTTATVSGILSTLKNPERFEGASPGDRIIMIAKKELDDASITPKLNDWVVDEDDQTWLVAGIRIDPLAAVYMITGRKL